MKKFKLFVSLIFVIFIALLIYQNREYFFAQQALSFSLGVETWNWTAPPATNVAYMGICLAFGLLLAGFMGLGSRFRLKKNIKSLTAEKAALQEEMTAMRQELHKFKQDPYLQPEPTSDVDGSDTVIEVPAETPSEADAKKADD